MTWNLSDTQQQFFKCIIKKLTADCWRLEKIIKADADNLSSCCYSKTNSNKNKNCRTESTTLLQNANSLSNRYWDTINHLGRERTKNYVLLFSTGTKRFIALLRFLGGNQMNVWASLAKKSLERLWFTLWLRASMRILKSPELRRLQKRRIFL
jgi:hypothetical protein